MKKVISQNTKDAREKRKKNPKEKKRFTASSFICERDRRYEFPPFCWPNLEAGEDGEAMTADNMGVTPRFFSTLMMDKRETYCCGRFPTYETEKEGRGRGKKSS